MEIETIVVELPKGHAITLLHALQTQFTTKGVNGAKVLIELCDALEIALNHEEE